MMRWRPWPPLLSKKYEVRLVVRKLEWCDLVPEGADKGGAGARLTVEIKWKGPKLALSSLRRTAVKRNFTREVVVEAGAGSQQNGVVEWDEEFQNLCTLSSYRDNVFHPWDLAFTVYNVSSLCLSKALLFMEFSFVGLLDYGNGMGFDGEEWFFVINLMKEYLGFLLDCVAFFGSES